MNVSYDVVVVGGGPAGLSAALTLGRATKRVLVLDRGAPRNFAAEQINGFLSRDGTPPAEFRAIARQQLQPYSSVEVVDEPALAIDGEVGSFQVRVGPNTVQTRRVLLCTGMVDEIPRVPGFEELWGRSIYQCPYCHGWEVRGKAFGVWAQKEALLNFSLVLPHWTDRVVIFVQPECEVSPEAEQRCQQAGIVLERRAVRRLGSENQRLTYVELEDGERREVDALFVKPSQHQVSIVDSLELNRANEGPFLQVDPTTLETSRRGIYAAGDLTTCGQAAIAAASAGMQAASMLNADLARQLCFS